MKRPRSDAPKRPPVVTHRYSFGGGACVVEFVGEYVHATPEEARTAWLEERAASERAKEGSGP